MAHLGSYAARGGSRRPSAQVCGGWWSDSDHGEPRRSGARVCGGWWPHSDHGAPRPLEPPTVGRTVGPHDNVFRLPWWVRRIARGGDVLAPGDPGRTVQLIDARDLARFIVDLGERGQPGVFNATAPPWRTTMGEVLDAAVVATGSDARLTWIPDDALVAAGATPWVELPLWIPEADGPGTWRIDTARAQAAGLRCRPVAETVGDVWAWLQAGGPEAEGPDWLSDHAPPPMAPEREAQLLAAVAR